MVAGASTRQIDENIKDKEAVVQEGTTAIIVVGKFQREDQETDLKNR